MDRRDFIAKMAIGLPVAGLGGAALLKPTVARATSTAPTPIYVASQYGTDPDSVANALSHAEGIGAGLIFENTNFTIYNINFSVLPFVIGMPGATLLPASGVTGDLITISVPMPGFEMGGFFIEVSGSLSSVLNVSNAEFGGYFHDLNITGSLSSGAAAIKFGGGLNTGCQFSNIQMSGGFGSGVDGFSIVGSVGTNGIYLVYDNTFINCSAAAGWNIDYANNVYINCSSGFNINHTAYSSFICGSSSGFSLTSNSTGILILGGQHTVTGNSPAQHNVILTTGTGVPFAYDPTSGLVAATLGTPAIADGDTPSGRTIRALPIYNAAGVLLGYAPLYASRW